MAKFRQIQTSFWSNTYIQEEMTAEDKYFYLYLMTNEFTTQIGIYSITKKQMAFDLGYSIESVSALLQRFETYHKLIKYDVDSRELILLKWAENNLNIGGKPVQDLIKKEIEQVKNKEFLTLMYSSCPENSLKNFIGLLIYKNNDSYNDSVNESSDGSLINLSNFKKNKKTNNLNNFYASSDASFNDTGAINNKEEIINNNNNNINNLKNIIEIQEQKEKVVVNSNGALQQEIKMLLGVRKIKVYDIIKLNKPIERIKFVIDFCNKNNKPDGYLFKALKDDWELKEVQQEEKTCYLTKPKEAYKELV